MGLSELYYLADILGQDRPEVRRMLQTAKLSPHNIHIIQKHMMLMVRQRGFDLSNLPLFSLTIPKAIDHDGIFIGNILIAEKQCGKLYLPTESFVLHNLIAGISGCGKSTIIKQIAPQLIEKGIKTIILDNESEYKSLLNFINPENILIIDTYDDKDNFLQPPTGSSPKEWFAKLKNLFREVFFLRDGSINLLSEVLTSLYEKSGVFAGGENYPTLNDLIRLLESKKYKGWSRTSGYQESLINRFKGLQDSLGNTLACEKGYEIEKKQGKLIIYRTANISDDIRSFYINLKMLREATYREKLPPQGLKTVFIIEEAHKLYNQKIAVRNDMGEPMMFSNSRTFRKRGIGCIYADQVPSELPAALSGNVSTHIIFRLVNSKCVWRVAQSINLNPQQAEYLTILPQRQCIIQSGDYAEPVLVEIPFQTFEYVTEEQVIDHKQNTIQKLSYKPISDYHISVFSTDAKTPSSYPEKNHKKDNAGQTWKAILNLVAERQPILLAEIYRNIDTVSNWQKKNILSEMENREMIETCRVSMGTKGNPKSYVVLRQSGAEFIGKNYKDVKLAGKGDTLHVIYQHLIANALKESGENAIIEYHFNGKAVDIAQIGDDRSIAYEIELKPSHPHVSENISKDLEAGFSNVIIVTTNKAGQDQVKDLLCNRVEWDKLKNVNFMLIKDILGKGTEKKGIK